MPLHRGGMSLHACALWFDPIVSFIAVCMSGESDDGRCLRHAQSLKSEEGLRLLKRAAPSIRREAALLRSGDTKGWNQAFIKDLSVPHGSTWSGALKLHYWAMWVSPIAGCVFGWKGDRDETEAGCRDAPGQRRDGALHGRRSAAAAAGALSQRPCYSDCARPPTELLRRL